MLKNLKNKIENDFQKLRNLISIVLITTNLFACGQQKQNRLELGRKFAEEEIKSALTDTTKHNFISQNNIIIKDSLTATTIAETILFGIYGEKNITKQRPYEIYHIDNYWLLTGTLPRDWKGGTFLIIIDDRDSKIIKITHGK